MSHDFRQNRAVQESDASKALDGSAQITKIKQQMTAFVHDFRARSDGRMVAKAFEANAQIDIAIDRLTKKLEEFARGEKEFATVTDLYDEDAAI